MLRIISLEIITENMNVTSGFMLFVVSISATVEQFNVEIFRDQYRNINN